MPISPEIRKKYYGHKWRTVTRPAALKRAGGKFEGGRYAGKAVCARCNLWDEFPNGKSILDCCHLVIPPGEPGHDDDSNLAILCKSCHGRMDATVAIPKRRETRLNHKDAAREIMAVGVLEIQ